MRINFSKIKAFSLQKPVNISSEQLKTLWYLPDEFLPAQKIGNYEDFMKKIRQTYGNISLKRLIRKCQNYEMGHGNFSRVLGIPQVDDYVLKVSHKTKLGFFDRVPRLEKTENNMYSYNFGQEIATNNSGVSVLLKTEGESYSFPGWIDLYNSNIYDGFKIRELEAEYFLEKNLARAAQLPQESFNRFAKKIYFLKKVVNRYIDFFNPNNLLIDYQNKEINIIDIGCKAYGGQTFELNKDMVTPFVDGYFKDDILQMLSPELREEFLRYEGIIVEKCKKAAQKCGLAE